MCLIVVIHRKLLLDLLYLIYYFSVIYLVHNLRLQVYYNFRNNDGDDEEKRNNRYADDDKDLYDDNPRTYDIDLAERVTEKPPKSKSVMQSLFEEPQPIKEPDKPITSSLFEEEKRKAINIRKQKYDLSKQKQPTYIDNDLIDLDFEDPVIVEKEKLPERHIGEQVKSKSRPVAIRYEPEEEEEEEEDYKEKLKHHPWAKDFEFEEVPVLKEKEEIYETIDDPKIDQLQEEIIKQKTKIEKVEKEKTKIEIPLYNIEKMKEIKNGQIPLLPELKMIARDLQIPYKSNVKKSELLDDIKNYINNNYKNYDDKDYDNEIGKLKVQVDKLDTIYIDEKKRLDQLEKEIYRIGSLSKSHIDPRFRKTPRPQQQKRDRKEYLFGEPSGTEPTTGKGLTRRSNLSSFGECLINPNSLYKNKIELYNNRNKLILSEKVDDNIKNVIIDLYKGDYNVDEILDKKDKNKLLEILKICKLPNPYIHESIGKKPANKHKQGLLERKLKIQEGEFRSGNDNEKPYIKKYYYITNNKFSRNNAKQQAIKQAKAIFSTGWRE